MGNATPFESDHKASIIVNINETLMSIAIPLLLMNTEAQELRVKANLL